MRIFMATLSTETNTFSLIPTGMAGTMRKCGALTPSLLSDQR